MEPSFQRGGGGARIKSKWVRLQSLALTHTCATTQVKKGAAMEWKDESQNGPRCVVQPMAMR